MRCVDRDIEGSPKALPILVSLHCKLASAMPRGLNVNFDTGLSAVRTPDVNVLAMTWKVTRNQAACPSLLTAVTKLKSSTLLSWV